jgi:DNA-binding MarR family transcriptional regulator
MESRQSGVVHVGRAFGEDPEGGGDRIEGLSVTTADQPPGQPSGQPPVEVVEATMCAARALLGIVVKSLAPVLEEITPGQLRALVILSSQGAQRAGVLAGMLGVHPSTFTRTVDRLAAGGWVTRSENPDSRREVLVELTPRGEQAVASVLRGRRRELEQVLASLPAADQRRVADGFWIFAKACSDPSVIDLAGLGG